jgi:two-component system response regulator FixJ
LDTNALVLVVEDDDSMRLAMQRLLNAAGHATRAYASAEELLAAPHDAAAACIVSDFQLPGLSGLDLLEALRARGQVTPFIMVTAHDSVALRNDAKHRGVAAYLTKPFKGSDLMAAIEAAVPRMQPPARSG